MRLTLSIVVGIVVFYLIVGLSIQAHYASRMGPQFTAGTNHLEGKLPRYNNMQRELGANEVYGKAHLSKDASAFLNQRVRWPSRTGEPEYLDGEVKGRVPLVAKNTPLTLDKSKSISYKNIDFSWLKEIGGFDYWDLNGAPPVRDRVAIMKAKYTAPYYFFATYPEPVFSDLYAFMRLRLMHGIATLTLRAALGESRQLAQLLASTETVNGYVVSGLMLVSEAEAYDYGVKQKIIKSKDWTPIRKGDEILKNGSIQPFAGYFGIYSNPKVVAATVGNPANNVGRCLAIIDGTREMAKYMPFVKRQFPFERDFSQLVESLTTTALDPSNNCRIPYVRKYWEGDEDFQSTSYLPFWQKVVQYLPYFRRAVVYKMLLDSRDIVDKSATQ